MYYLINAISNKDWYKIIDPHYTEYRYLYGYRPIKYFESKHFIVYITERLQETKSEDQYLFNVYEIDKKLKLMYHDDILIVYSDRQQDNKLLKFINKIYNQTSKEITPISTPINTPNH